MPDYVIHTNLDEKALTQAAITIYEHWLAFATGEGEVGGRKLANPSGKYASSITVSPMHRNGGVIEYEIYADYGAAPQGQSIEQGRPAYDMREKLLSSPKTKISKSGNRYRRVVITNSNTPAAGRFLSGVPASISGVMNAGIRIWAKPLEITPESMKTIRTVSDNHSGLKKIHPFSPSADYSKGVFGGERWRIPAFVPYRPAQILSELYRAQYGGEGV